MRKIDIVLLIFGVVTFGVILAWSFQQTQGRQFLTMALVLVAFVIPIHQFFILVKDEVYRKKILSWMCIFAPFMAIPIAAKSGSSIRDIYFRSQLESLESKILTLPEDEATTWCGARFVTHTNVDGDKLAHIWWGSGFPVKHTVLAYHSGTEPEASVFFRKSWKSLRHFKGNWWILGN